MGGVDCRGCMVFDGGRTGLRTPLKEEVGAGGAS